MFPKYVIKSFIQECRLGHLENVKFLVENGEKITDEAFTEACKNNRYDIINYLIEVEKHRFKNQVKHMPIR